MLPESESPAAIGAGVPESLPRAGGTFAWPAFLGTADAHGMFPSEFRLLSRHKTAKSFLWVSSP